MGTIEHSHQSLLVIDSSERDDNRRVGDDQVQVVFGEIEVKSLKLKCQDHELKLPLRRSQLTCPDTMCYLSSGGKWIWCDI